MARYMKRKSKKQMKRKLYKRRYRRPDTGNVVKFKETFDAGFRNANASQLPLQFRLTDLGQISQYQALFKNVKLTGVKLTWVPTYMGGEINTSIDNANNARPYAGTLRLLWSIQRGRVDTITSELAMLQKQHGLRVLADGKPYSIFIKNPVAALDVDSAGGLTNNSMYKTGYLDLTNSADVFHNGLEFYLVNSGTQPLGCKLYVTYYFTCKNQQ